MFQKAVKTVDDVPKQTSRTPSAKKQRLDSGAASEGRPEKSFDLSKSVFPPAQSMARQSSASAAATARDESKTVSCCHQLTNFFFIVYICICCVG